MSEHTILVVDDDEFVLKTIGRFLIKQGYKVDLAESGAEAIEFVTALADADHEYIGSPGFDLVITDLIMEGRGGLDVLREVKRVSPETMVMILTGYGDLQSAISAIRAGVDDYLLKSCDSEELLFRVSKCLEKCELKKKIKIYENLLPVCCQCKNVRDDADGQPGKGPWMAMESFLERTAKLQVTHTYCPECAAQYRSEISDARKKRF